ncbi:MAG: hypothetical protein ACE10H_17165 [Candidatus Binatia bacterium]
MESGAAQYAYFRGRDYPITGYYVKLRAASRQTSLPGDALFLPLGNIYSGLADRESDGPL